MRYNETELTEVAIVVQAMNQYRRGSTVGAIVASMKHTGATSDLRDGGYVATGGYVLSAYRDPTTGETSIKASVDAIIATDYLKSTAAGRAIMASLPLAAQYVKGGE